MRRRRHKTRYTWLPADGNPITSGDITIKATPFSVGTQLIAGTDSGNGIPDITVTNCIADFPETDLDSAAVTMADAIGSEYFIKRIVGKVFCGAVVKLAANVSSILRDDCPAVFHSVGFFIAATDPANAGAPLGTATDLLRRYNPLALEAIREPWIWRRTWLLHPLGNIKATPGNEDVAGFPLDTGADTVRTSAPGSELGHGAFPSTNAAYGSVLDGPHCDAKTARRVRLHERLWVAAATMTAPEGDTIDAAKIDKIVVSTSYDIRVLGALRKARNRSSIE